MFKGTFNLPSVIGSRTITGTNDINGIGYKDVGGLPNIVGTLKTTGSLGGDQQSSTSGGTGALSSLQISSCFNYGAGGRGNQTNGISFDASRSSNIYNSNNSEVQPKRIMMYYIVKY